jgi:hypothetical protein
MAPMAAGKQTQTGHGTMLGRPEKETLIRHLHSSAYT